MMNVDDRRITGESVVDSPFEVSLPLWTAPILTRLDVVKTLNGSASFGDGGNHFQSSG